MRPSDVKFEVDIPAEVLAKDWRPVLKYLRELEEQVGDDLVGRLAGGKAGGEQ